MRDAISGHQMHSVAISNQMQSVAVTHRLLEGSRLRLGALEGSPQLLRLGRALPLGIPKLGQLGVARESSRFELARNLAQSPLSRRRRLEQLFFLGEDRAE